MKTAQDLVSKGVGAQMACESLGVSRGTFYRHRKPRAVRESATRTIPANRLSDQERSLILSTLHQEEYVDQCPREIVPKLADKGIYLGSIRTFYRVLSENEEVRERRLQARRNRSVIPSS